MKLLTMQFITLKSQIEFQLKFKFPFICIRRLLPHANLSYWKMKFYENFLSFQYFLLVYLSSALIFAKISTNVRECQCIDSWRINLIRSFIFTLFRLIFFLLFTTEYRISTRLLFCSTFNLFTSLFLHLPSSVHTIHSFFSSVFVFTACWIMVISYQR